MMRKKLLTACAAAFGVALGAFADFTETNPVTGETETYTYKYVGTDGSWTTAANWSPEATPYIANANAYSAAVVDGASAVSSSSQIDGWDLRFGAYNGATVTWANLSKLQCDGAQWITVDGTSKLTVNGWGGGNLGQNGQSRSVEISVASQEGLVFAVDLSSGNDYGLAFNYRFAGSGSVSYQALGIASHVIKQADVTLSGSATPSVMSKTLVSFTSTTKTFTADAEIKIYASDGETLAKTASLASVASGATTLTAASGVGACELVQTATGVVLYYVDGDEADIATAEYKPSINVNFTSGDAPLTTAADVGLSGYAVPGTAWNNLAVANNATLTTVNAVDATGAATTVAGASVTITGTRGSYSCASLSPATDLRHGYIDENAGNPTPTVTVEGIPYGYYRVIVYAATDAANYPFGYVSVNGTDYTYVDGELQTGTTSWGASGASNTAEAIAEGVNTLVSDVTSGSTLTVVGHRIDGTARGCIAAIQIVEVAVGDNDLIINVSGDKTYAVDEAKSYDNVYVIGSGTLTFSGEAKITAGVLDIDRAATVNMDASRLDASAVTGSGAAVYSGSLPPTTLGWTDADAWNGTLWLKSVAVSELDTTSYGNESSVLRFTGVTGYLQRAKALPVPIELVDDGSTVAFAYNNGWSQSVVSIAEIRGTGTLSTSGSGNAQTIYIANADKFTGTLNLTSQKVFIGGEAPTGTTNNGNGRLTVAGSATVPSGITWTANGGFAVSGELYVNGALATSSGTVSGSGLVAFDGALPATSLGWTDSTAWTGTLWLKNITHSGTTSGDGRNFNPASFGNSLSTVRLTGVLCYFPSGAVTCDAKVELVDDGSTVALEVDNGSGGATYTFAELAGTGTLKGTGTGGANANSIHYIRVLKWSSFTGNIDMETRTVLFTTNTANSGTPWGSATTYTKGDGTIYIDAEETAVVQASSATWKAKRFVVEGTLEANGTLATNGTVTAAAAGTGTVVFTGRAPTPAGDGWWKNSLWQGTVKIADVSNMVGSGSGTVLDFNSYGNTGSFLELSNVTGWVPSGYNCTVPLKISGLTINNGYSNTTTTFSKVTGEGDLTFAFSSGSNYKLVIGVLTNFTGTLYSSYASNPVQIETLELPETPESGTLLVKVGSSHNHVTLTSVKIGQETLPAASVVKLQDGNDGYGFYFTASQLSYEIDEDTVITELEGWADDAVASIRVTGSCALTIPEGTSIGALNLTLADGVTLSFANSGTVTLLTATGANGTLRFTSDFEIPAGFTGDATVEVADGVTLTAPYVNISSDGTTSDYAGAFTGGEGATIAMPLALSGHGDITSYENLNSLLKLNDPEGWKGTLVLSGEVGRFALKQFGNTNSTVRVDGLASDVAPWSYGADMHVVKTLEIGDGGWTLKASDYTGDQIVVPAELTGEGTLTVNATGGARIFFTGDVSAFAGAVAIGSSAAVQVQFIDRADAEATTDPTTLDGCVDYAANTVAVAKGATVYVSKAWTVPNSWTGAGRIVFAAPYLVNKAVADSWTGTVELAAIAPTGKTAIWLDRMASANSVFVLKGIQPGTTNRIDETAAECYFAVHPGATTAAAGTMQLDGDVLLTDGNSSANYRVARLTGSGNFAVDLLSFGNGTNGAQNITYTFTTVSNYTGVLKAANTGKVAIGAIEFAYAPEENDLLLAVDEASDDGAVTVTSIQVGETSFAASEVAELRDGDSGYGYYWAVPPPVSAEGVSYDSIAGALDAGETNIAVSVSISGESIELTVPLTIISVPSGATLTLASLTIAEGAGLSVTGGGTLVVPVGTVFGALSVESGTTLKFTGSVTEADQLLFSHAGGTGYADFTASTGNIAVGSANVRCTRTTIDGTTEYRAGRKLYWTGGSSGNWGDVANWSLEDGSAVSALGQNSDKVTGDHVFVTNAASISVANFKAVVTRITVDADVTFHDSGFTAGSSHAYGMWFDMMDGSGAVTLDNIYVAVISSSGRPFQIDTDLCITEGGTLFYCYGTTPSTLNGDLSGTGTLSLLYGANGGLAFYGDNGEFAGTLAAEGAYNGLSSFYYGNATSSNAVWQINGNNASATQESYIRDDGTYWFGALSGYLNLGGHAATIVIGGRDDEVSYLNMTSSGDAKIVKVGAGTAIHSYSGSTSDGNAYNIIHTHEIQGGTLVLTNGLMPQVAITFTGEGGTLRMPSYASGDETVSPDPSALIKNSTAPITYDTNGENQTWTNSLASSNVGGFVKVGAGTLTLTAVPQYSGLTTVEAGTLVVPPGTALGELAFGSSGVLKVDLTGVTEDGVYFSAKAAPGMTLTENDVQVIADAGADCNVIVNSSGTALAVAMGSGYIFVWNGPTSGDYSWEYAGNWTDRDGNALSRAPTPIDSVVFNTATPGVVCSDDVAVMNLTATHADGLSLSCGAAVTVYGDASIAGTLRLDGMTSLDVAGALDVSSVELATGSCYAASETCTAKGYQARLSGNQAIELDSFSGAGVIAGDGDLTLSVADGSSTTFIGSITGSRSVTKSGDGELVLFGDSDFTGDFTISAGSVRLATPLDLDGLRSDFDASRTDLLEDTDEDGDIDNWHDAASLIAGNHLITSFDQGFSGTKSPVLTNDVNYAAGQNTVYSSNFLMYEDHSETSIDYLPRSFFFVCKYDTAKNWFAGNWGPTPSECYNWRISRNGSTAYVLRYGNGTTGYEAMWLNGEHSGSSGIPYPLSTGVASLVGHYNVMRGEDGAPQQMFIGGNAGIGYNEILTYTRELPYDERTAVEKYLMAKWGVEGAKYEPVPATAALAMSAGTTLDLGGQTLNVASFSGSGTISNGTLVVASGRYVATGPLECPAVDNAVYVLSGSSAALVLTGEATGVTVDATAIDGVATIETTMTLGSDFSVTLPSGKWRVYAVEGGYRIQPRPTIIKIR